MSPMSFAALSALAMAVLSASSAHAGSVRLAMVPVEPGVARDFSADLALDFTWDDDDAETIEVTLCNLGDRELFVQSFTAQDSDSLLVSPTLVTRNGAIWLSGERTSHDPAGARIAPFVVDVLPGPADPAYMLTLRFSLAEGTTPREAIDALFGAGTRPAWVDIDAEIAIVTARGLEDSGHFSPLVVVPLPRSVMAGAVCIGGVMFGSVVRRRRLAVG